MTAGAVSGQVDLLDDLDRFCGALVPEGSVYAWLHREREALFPEGMFDDLFSARGRRSVPPVVVAVVMVLQRFEGLSDREAVQRYCFDARWRYACGVGGYGAGGWQGFSHTVLVDMRARLAASDDPDRVFAVVLGAARAAGLVGRRRVLDSTPLYDAVATMDTVTLIRSAIRGLLGAACPELDSRLRAALVSGDDYAAAGKPVIDWDDAGAREELVDVLARDGRACLAVLDGGQWDEPVAGAGALLATVLGQDLEEADGVFRIARRVARDRVISTVDPQARHGHKTSARGFDGYKGHIAIDPDSELITATAVTAGNAGDAQAAAALITDLTPATPAEPAQADASAGAEPGAGRAAVYGDAAYGAGQFLEHLDTSGIESRCKTQPPPAAGGRFSKDRFGIDLDAGTVTCPNQVSAPIRRDKHGDGTARFAAACASCPLAAQCTTSRAGRTVTVSRHEALLAQGRAATKDPEWAADYRATRPKVERRIGTLMHRKHGGRRARMRGTTKIGADFSLLAAAHNIARLAVLGIRSTASGWQAGTA